MKRFDVIKVTFPERGHSYLKCDKDFGIINQKSRVEVLSQWNNVYIAARQKPTPFGVHECHQDFFFVIGTAFCKKCTKSLVLLPPDL